MSPDTAEARYELGHGRTILVCFLLLAATLAAYWPVHSNQFTNYDDQDYVTDNPMVQAGLSWKGVAWAFSTDHAGNWHPLTWLSHMLDCQLYGMNAGGHHITNLILHIANTLLLFGVLRNLTGALWRSALVAALFGLHPLHVESVAWVAERKDVLSTFFFLLTILAYAHYARNSAAAPKAGVGAKSHLPRLAYVLALVFFALGLMSKPMLVTTPFVLLLLDFWPLRRLNLAGDGSGRKRILALVGEKLPFFALSIASSIVTFAIQNGSGAVSSLERLPLPLRLENVCGAYFAYLQKMLWPVGLAPFYPYPMSPASGAVALSILVLIGASAAVFVVGRECRYMAVGWLWYLGTLVPVIGVVQVGQQSMADRYTYIPLIGIFIAVVWGLREATARWQPARHATGITALVVLPVLAITTYAQAQKWKDSETLFRHTLAVTKNNYLAHYTIGAILVEQGNIPEATKHFAEAVRLQPTYGEAQSDYGLALAFQGKYEEAIEHYRTAIRMKPRLERAHYNLGRALEATGKREEAVTEYEEALRLKPGFVEPRSALAPLLGTLGRYDEAAVQFSEVVRLKPEDPDMHFNLGKALQLQGKVPEATAEFATVVRLRPGDAEAHEKLGVLLAQQNQIAEAIEHFEKSLQLHPTAQAHYDLGLALIIQQKRKQGAQEYRRALELQPDWPLALNDLAWILATAPEPELRNGAEAVRLAERACELTSGQEPRFLGTLDAAYAEAGRFQDALSTVALTRERAQAAGQQEISKAAEQRAACYRAGRSFHQ